MKCAMIVMLAVVGMVVGNPISPLGYGYGYGYGLSSPLLLPSTYSVSSNIINHGVTIPKVVVTAPIVRPVITPVAVPVVKTVVAAPVVSNWGLGWNGAGLGWNGAGLGWSGAGLGWGKGWH